MVQLAITKKTSLAEFEGWEDCFLIWRPATFKDKRELKGMNTDNVSEEDAADAIFKKVSEKIVSGKVRVLSDEGESQLVDYKPEHLEQLPYDFISRLYMEINGVKFEDPKDLSPAQTPSESHSTPESTTETPSSEA
ncbi:hypothetical protein [Streptomyces turgidiscabies]|uniref:hypothetical protein n=1 Tax=Streptomyces turgidiscabies TaxID=85558 RepID=UPI0038F80F08